LSNVEPLDEEYSDGEYSDEEEYDEEAGDDDDYEVGLRGLSL
jgi:hypothetical protein